MSRSTRVSSRPSAKYQKSGSANSGDRISNLPIDIIGHVLSLIPIKDAVRTCVLSRNWESMWTFIHTVELSDFQLFDEHEEEEEGTYVNETFVAIAGRILFQLQNVRSLRIFCSIVGEFEATHILSWLSGVLRRNIESLEICLEECNYDNFILPRTLLNCTSLIKLKLELPCTFKITRRSCFPNLTTLWLEDVMIVNENSNTDTLIFNFPVLETIHLNCSWWGVKFVELYAPSLTGFESRSSKDLKSNDTENYTIKILGSRLSTFDIFCGYPENYVLDGSSVTRATLNNFYTSNSQNVSLGLHARKLLRKFQELEDLELSGYLVQCIEQSKLGCSLPNYNMLRRLVVNYLRVAEGLLELLHAIPFLKFLKIKVASYNEDLDDYDYGTVESVPSCIISHLEDVEFNYYRRNYSGRKIQFRLEKFILKNSLQLKNICISGDNRPPKDQVLENLSKFLKGSTILTFGRERISGIPS